MAQSEPQAQGQPSPTSYAELIELARAKRDILVVTALEQSLRPVSMTDGRLDVALVPGADAGIIQVLSAKLKLWTGKHWMVSVNTSAEAVPTIREQRDQAKADSKSEAVRALKPGDAATMDFNPNRLNIILDDKGAATSVNCG